MTNNSCTFIGYLTKDPELRYTPHTLKPVASFTIAIKNERADDVFVDCVAWRELAEQISKKFRKGSAVVFTGRVTTRKWEDKATGKTRYKTEFVADSVEPFNKYEQARKEEEQAKLQEAFKRHLERGRTQMKMEAGDESTPVFVVTFAATYRVKATSDDEAEAIARAEMDGEISRGVFTPYLSDIEEQGQIDP